MKPTIPEASRSGISPVSSRWPSGPKFYICPTRNCEKAIPTSPKGRYNRKPRGRDVGELLRLEVFITFSIALLVFSCGQKEPTLFRLLDASQTGIDFQNTIVENDSVNVFDYMNVYTGAGVAVGDIDNDGLTDVYFSGNMVSGRLYRNLGNLKFEDITEISGMKNSRWGTGATMVDINQDGLLDIYICVSGSAKESERANMLYINNGPSEGSGQITFTEKAAEFGLADTRQSMHSAFFDYDKDGDLDMYLVSGSNQFIEGSDNYRDRFYLNDGNGKFIEDATRIPEIKTSGTVVKAMDFNADGYVDLFVGGRTPMGEYPMPEKSFLLINENGTLKDVTDNLAPELRNVGMITDALWSDYNADGQQDLIVVGELMPITIFKNKNAYFEKVENTGIQNFMGWWESITAADMDNDGDIDFVAGNLGRNNLYQPSEERPVTIFAKDFDQNGSIDPVTFAYFKNTVKYLAHIAGFIRKGAAYLIQ